VNLKKIIDQIKRFGGIQLKQYQHQSSIRVYRGQVMSIDELNTLRQSIHNLISINSFFSTSTNRHKAVGFLNSSEITLLLMCRSSRSKIKTIC